MLYSNLWKPISAILGANRNYLKQNLAQTGIPEKMSLGLFKQIYHDKYIR
jgi:hypothetical protein